jgi:hypothetical protein
VDLKLLKRKEEEEDGNKIFLCHQRINFLLNLLKFFQNLFDGVLVNFKDDFTFSLIIFCQFYNRNNFIVFCNFFFIC